MRKHLGFAALGALGILIQSCSSSPLRTAEADGAQIGSYKTYQWLTPEVANDMKFDRVQPMYISALAEVHRDTSIESQVRAEIEQGLRKDGYQPSTDRMPDFYVTFYGKAKDGRWISSWEGTTPSLYDVPVVIFPDFETKKMTRSYRDGTVYLVVYDAKTRKPAWTGEIQAGRFETGERKQEIVKAIHELVDKFAQG